jgi:hypothetical protein
MLARSTNTAPVTAIPTLACVALLVCALQGSAALADDVQATPQAPVNRAVRPARLDLSLGDLSRYFDAVALASPPPDDIEEIVVRGRKPEPLPEQRLIPQGLIGAVAYGFANPLQAWRILVPDPNVQIPDRSEDDVRDPPGAHRARILEPGRIYD